MSLALSEFSDEMARARRLVAVTSVQLWWVMASAHALPPPKSSVLPCIVGQASWLSVSFQGSMPGPG